MFLLCCYDMKFTTDIKHSTRGIFWFAWPFRYVVMSQVWTRLTYSSVCKDAWIECMCSCVHILHPCECMCCMGSSVKWITSVQFSSPAPARFPRKSLIDLNNRLDYQRHQPLYGKGARAPPSNSLLEEERRSDTRKRRKSSLPEQQQNYSLAQYIRTTKG